MNPRRNSTSGRSWRSIGLCGMGLPVTGLVNHFRELSPVTVAAHAWHSAHNVLGVLFVFFSVWHIVLNRRPLWNYLRSKTSRVLSISRELVLAWVVVVSVLLMFVAGLRGGGAA